jgi:CrcB protein
MFTTLIQVALGGAIGASGRYLLGMALFRPTAAFPIGILSANVIGCFLMGAMVVLLGQKGLAHLNPFLLTGVLGGFTTFSAFSLEAMTLYERGALGLAALYVALSVILSLAALAAGIHLARGALT